jgi:hypothetical protein
MKQRSPMVKHSKVPASPEASKPASAASVPGNLFEDLLDQDSLRKLQVRPKSALLKKTFYLTPEDIELLETERARRRRTHGRSLGIADLSLLVREAIRKCYGSG